MDPTPWEVDWVGEQGEIHPRERAIYMKELYPYSIDNLPHDMPEASGEGLNIRCFVDADHTGNKLTRRSHAGIIIFLNSAPIVWKYCCMTLRRVFKYG